MAGNTIGVLYVTGGMNTCTGRRSKENTCFILTLCSVKFLLWYLVL